MLILIIAIVLLLAFLLFVNFHPQFGAKITKADKSRYALSKQWDGEKFVNQSVTVMDVNLKTLPGLLKEQFTNRKPRTPEQPIPIRPFDEQAWNQNPLEPKFVWYGHSVVLLQFNGKNLLIDPMFGSDTAPIAPFDNKRFSENTLALIDDLPKIDAVLLTHDHYDHLDYASIKKLKSKIDTWFVALGVARHLVKWGIPMKSITEFDWWDKTEFEGIQITFTPTRHFSGRGPFDRAKSLWGGWVFKTSEQAIYWSGDSGYDEHFKEIGEKLGPFDWGFMECGQYNERWHAIHMYPEECVQAAIDARVSAFTPVHWAGFPLALHAWKDPIERCMAEAAKQKVSICAPELGEIISIDNPKILNKWWEALA